MITSSILDSVSIESHRTLAIKLLQSPKRGFLPISRASKNQLIQALIWVFPSVSRTTLITLVGIRLGKVYSPSQIKRRVKLNEKAKKQISDLLIWVTTYHKFQNDDPSKMVINLVDDRTLLIYLLRSKSYL